MICPVTNTCHERSQQGTESSRDCSSRNLDIGLSWLILQICCGNGYSILLRRTHFRNPKNWEGNMLPLSSRCLNPSGKDTTKEFSTEWELEFKICPGFSVCEKNNRLKSSPKISIQFHPHPTGYQCNQQCNKAGHMPHSAAKPPRSSWWLGNGLVETADHQLSYQCDKVVSHGKSWYSNLQ